MWERTKRHALHEAGGAAAPTRVLLADDDDEMRVFLASALRRDGYVVEEARDGAQLLARVCSMLFQSEDGTAVDILVADIRMPGHSGLDVLSIVRGADWAVPIVLITAFGDEDTHAKARQLGANAVLDKPFELTDLRSTMSQLAPPL